MNSEKKFYDGTKLLSLKDINGKDPEIYICTTNRSAGKTTYFSRLLVRRFLKNGEKFIVLYRYKNELSDAADKFFKDIGSLFFPDYEMTEESKCGGCFKELYIKNIKEKEDPRLSCGYVVALNSADTLKKYSHFFSDVTSILFDEFQSESDHYCSNEINKFISLHTSIARGGGKFTRRVPVYMLSNYVSIINPYYVALGISTRLRPETKFLKGDGFVLEQGFNEHASDEQKGSGFNRAFADNNYLQYSTERIYLNDSATFIEKPSGRSRYLLTLKYEGVFYGVREFIDAGVVYCDRTPDLSFPDVITVNESDQDVNYIMLRNNEGPLFLLRYYFKHGAVRFKDLGCKNAILSALSLT